MRHSVLSIFLFLVAITVTSCHNDEVMDTTLIKGQWELASDSPTDSHRIYDFTTPSDQTWSWGMLNTYVVTASGSRIDGNVYDWHVSDPRNDSPVMLDITLKGDNNSSDDIWDGQDRFIVEQLSGTAMTLRKYEVGDTKTQLRFKRVSDKQK